jgi:hypothetical protein
MSDWHFAQTIGVDVANRSFQLEASLGDHSFTISESTMAWRAVDVESLLPALQQVHVDFGWDLVNPLTIVDTSEEDCVCSKVAPSDGALEQRSRCLSVWEEVTLIEWVRLLLNPHVCVTATEKQSDCGATQSES